MEFTRQSIMQPDTKYAKSGGVNIAYQVVGEGNIDLVFVPGWVSHIEYAWEEPSFAPFLERMASFSRLILLDRRGTGLSDPVDRLPTLEERMDDVRAVMDAAGSQRAFLFGISESGPMCTLLRSDLPGTHRRAGTLQHLCAQCVCGRPSVGDDSRAMERGPGSSIEQNGARASPPSCSPRAARATRRSDAPGAASSGAP